MKTKMFKRIFSSLLGLSLLLGMNNLSFAADNDFPLNETTANIKLIFSNAALTEGAEVRANVQVKFSTPDPDAKGKTKLCAIGIPSEFPFADLDYADPAFIAPDSGSPFGRDGSLSGGPTAFAFTYDLRSCGHPDQFKASWTRTTSPSCTDTVKSLGGATAATAYNSGL